MSLGFADYNEAHEETRSYKYFMGMHQQPAKTSELPENEPVASPVISPVGSPLVSPTSSPTLVVRNAPGTNSEQLGSPSFTAVANRLNSNNIESFGNVNKNENGKPKSSVLKVMKNLQDKQMNFMTTLEKRQQILLAYLQKKQQQENQKIMGNMMQIMQTNQQQMGELMETIVNKLTDSEVLPQTTKEVTENEFDIEDYFSSAPGKITTRSDVNRQLQEEVDFRKFFGNTLHPKPSEEIDSELNCDPELDSLFKTPVVPRDGAQDFLKYSDENPLARPFNNVTAQLIADRIWISDLQKNESGDPPEDFAVELNYGFRNVSEIYPLIVDIRWTPTATYTRNVLLRFPDFDHFQSTSNGFRYHNYIPLVQGTPGTPLTFSYRLDDDYSTDFRKFNKIGNKLRVQVFKEDSTSGEFEPFEELDAIAIELRIKCIDQDIHTVPILDYPKGEVRDPPTEPNIVVPPSEPEGLIPLIVS